MAPDTTPDVTAPDATLSDKPTILLLGATGMFGGWLARDLAALDECNLIIAARSADKLQDLAADLGCDWSSIDRTKLTAQTLSNLRHTGLLIDAAGPFQGDDGTVIKSCIKAGWDYVDLADGRAFVSRISVFNKAAIEAGCSVISGASSTPALSHAALDVLTKGWQSIDSVSVAICPGNKAPRGLSVMQAILGWVGEPVKVFNHGGWHNRPGWSGTQMIDLHDLGKRPAALAETPDLDALVTRYKPTLRAEMLAGLELPLLHNGVRLLGWLRAKRLLLNLRTFARPARWLANLLIGIGSDTGGMRVTATGVNSDGLAVCKHWTLLARNGVGPRIPGLPALALARQWLSNGLPKGASSAAGVLDLDELEPDFKRLSLQHITSQTLLPAPLYHRAMGDAFEELPEITRRFHTPRTALVLSGEVTITGAQNAMGRLISKLFRFPQKTGKATLTVTVEATADGAEIWRRDFGGHVMTSTLANPNAADSTVTESFGPVTTTLRLDRTQTGLTMTPICQHIGRFRLPRFTLPGITAIESWAAPNNHHFEVEISLPVLGRLCRYQGWVSIPPPVQ
ncbi:MAG: DUF4166 domain-containing protein [Alphaproteobacteria bacterium]